MNLVSTHMSQLSPTQKLLPAGTTSFSIFTGLYQDDFGGLSLGLGIFKEVKSSHTPLSIITRIIISTFISMHLFVKLTAKPEPTTIRSYTGSASERLLAGELIVDMMRAFFVIVVDIGLLELLKLRSRQ
jgi:hypothetical protein